MVVTDRNQMRIKFGIQIPPTVIRRSRTIMWARDFSDMYLNRCSTFFFLCCFQQNTSAWPAFDLRCEIRGLLRRKQSWEHRRAWSLLQAQLNCSVSRVDMIMRTIQGFLITFRKLPAVDGKLENESILFISPRISRQWNICVHDNSMEGRRRLIRGSTFSRGWFYPPQSTSQTHTQRITKNATKDGGEEEKKIYKKKQ